MPIRRYFWLPGHSSDKYLRFFRSVNRDGDVVVFERLLTFWW
jgi:hypothetical protein